LIRIGRTTKTAPGSGGEPGFGVHVHPAFDTVRHLQLSKRRANKHQVNWKFAMSIAGDGLSQEVCEKSHFARDRHRLITI
jgi:hypothetical protein